MTERETIAEYERLARLTTSGATGRIAKATSDRIDDLRLAMLHLAARRRAMIDASKVALAGRLEGA